jgi:hypothetical protein
LSESVRGLTGGLACRPACLTIYRDCPILGDTRSGRRGRLAASSLRGTGYGLAGHTPGDAESDPESAANGLRLHFDLMVTARLPAGLSTPGRQLPVALRRRKK